MIINGGQVKIQLHLFVIRGNIQQPIRNPLVNLPKVLYNNVLGLTRISHVKTYQSYRLLVVFPPYVRTPQDSYSGSLDKQQQ
jgi:hypothetical protein